MLWSTGVKAGPNTQKEWQEQESSEQTRQGVASMLWKEAGEESLDGVGCLSMEANNLHI